MRLLIISVFCFLSSIMLGQKERSLNVELGGTGLYSIQYERWFAEKNDFNFSYSLGFGWMPSYFNAPLMLNAYKGNGKHYLQTSLGILLYASKGSDIAFPNTGGDGKLGLLAYAGYYYKPNDKFGLKLGAYMGTVESEFGGLPALSIVFPL